MIKQIFLDAAGQHEEVLFRADGVTATNSKFTFEGHTYRFEDIVNINTWEYKPGGGIIVLGAAILLTISIFFSNGPGVLTGAILLSLSAYWFRSSEQPNTHILKVKFSDDERVIIRFKRNEDCVALLRVYYLYLLTYELASPVFAMAKEA